MSRYRVHVFKLILTCLALILSVFAAKPLLPTLAAGPSIRLSLNVGPPTTITKVQGKGFKDSTIVSINFDTTLIATVTTSKNGTFFVTVPVPKSALPGNHTILATSQKNGLFAQAIFLVQTNWPVFGFTPQHTNFNPYENVLNISNVSNLTLAWTVTMGSPIITSPAATNGVITIIPNLGSLNFYDAATGASLGNIDTPPQGGSVAGGSSPALVNGASYVGASSNLYAFSTSTGNWNVVTGGQIDSSPEVANGIVYFGSEDHNLYAVNAATGTILWTFTSGNAIVSSPAVSKGTVYFGSEDGNLYALNATTGGVVWNVPVGAEFSSPTVANGIVYIGGNNGLYALNASTGTILWNVPSLSNYGSSAAVADGVVYIGTANDILYALNASTGSILWTTQVLGNGPITAAPTVANGVVYLGSADHHLYALNATTGKVLWMYAAGNNVESPIVVNGMVYVGAVDGNLYAFHLLGPNL